MTSKNDVTFAKEPRCPHHEIGTPFFERVDETDKRQHHRLSEGMCPNRCGPMKKTGTISAVCGCCKIKWTSMRIAVIFKRGSGDDVIET